MTYKRPPGAGEEVVEITHVYGRDEAREAIERSREDYRERFPDLADRLRMALGGG